MGVWVLRLQFMSSNTQSAFDISEIDESSLGTFTTSIDNNNAEINSIFPPDPDDEPEKQSEKQTDEGKKQQPEALPLAGDRRSESTSHIAGGADSLSKKKKRKVNGKGRAAAAVALSAVNEAKEKRRQELREKIRTRAQLQRELGGKASAKLNQVGATLDDVGQAAKDEASGIPMSNTKQEAVMKRAESMFASTIKGMDAKQRNFLSKKKEEISGMTTDLLDKMISGPGKKGGPAGAAKKKLSALEQAAFGDSETKDELDPRLESVVRSVHQNSSSSSEASSGGGALPIRPRARDVAKIQEEKAKAVAKNQAKNKKKRQKIKDKLKTLKTSSSSASQEPAIPELIPATS